MLSRSADFQLECRTTLGCRISPLEKNKNSAHSSDNEIQQQNNINKHKGKVLVTLKEMLKVVTSMVSDLAPTFLNEVNSSSIQFLFLRFSRMY